MHLAGGEGHMQVPPHLDQGLEVLFLPHLVRFQVVQIHPQGFPFDLVGVVIVGQPHSLVCILDHVECSVVLTAHDDDPKVSGHFQAGLCSNQLTIPVLVLLQEHNLVNESPQRHLQPLCLDKVQAHGNVLTLAIT